MNFFTTPPYFFTNVPKFLLKRHTVRFFKKLIEWSIVEYYHAIQFYRGNGNERAASKIEKYFTPVSVLAKYPRLKDLCKSLLTDQEIWNMLSKQEQKVLTTAYNL